MYLKRSAELYGHILNQVTGGITTSWRSDYSQVYLDGAVERTYEARFYNTSEGKEILFEKILTRLPKYEAYVSGSATLTYYESSAAGTSIPLDHVTQVKTIGDRRIMQFDQSETVAVPNNPKEGRTGLPGDTGNRAYISLKFKTTIAGADMTKVLQDLAEGKNIHDTSAFASAFYLKGTDPLKKGGTYLTEVNDEAENWDNSTATTKFYTGNYLASYNYLNTLVLPGVTIKPYKVLKEGANDEVLSAIGEEGVTPGMDAGFKVTVGNNSSKAIVNPDIIVSLPLGTTFKGFLNGEQPAKIKSYDVQTVDKKQTVTFKTDGLTLSTGAGSTFDFDIKVDTTKALGVQYADAYLVPMNQFEVFTSLYTALGGTRIKENYNGVSGQKAEATDKEFYMVQASCSIPIFGQFAFSSDITVEEKADAENKASSGGSIEVARDSNSFTYTLNFKNEAKEKIYENFVIVNRLPGKEDLYNVNKDARGSNENVTITSEPVVKLDGVTLEAGKDYVIQYSSDPRTTVYDNNEEYSQKDTADPAANWSESIDKKDATALRILFNENVDPKETIQVIYDAQFTGPVSDLPRKGISARNSFGFGLNAKGFTQLYYAEPMDVGVTLANKYISQLDGKIYVDIDGDGVYTAGTDKPYTDKINVFLYADGDTTTPVSIKEISDGTGEYKFTDLKEGTDYEVGFAVPADYELSTKNYKTVGIAATPVENNFKMTDGRAAGTFSTPAGEDSQFYANGALNKTAGTINGQIFIDNDKDGKYDAAKGDKLFDKAISVDLVDKDGKVVKTVTTDVETGKYTFGSVLLGDYKVKFDAPTGYKRTEASTDFSGTIKLTTDTISLTAANSEATKNAGLIKTEDPKNPTKTVTSDKGKDGAAVKVGDEITYTIKYFNHNPDPADVKITDELDSGVKFVSAVGGTHSGEEAGGTVTWNIKDAPAEKEGTVTVTVKVLPTAAATVKNDASVQIGNTPTVKTDPVTNPVNIDVKYEWVSTDNPTDVTKPDGDTIAKNSEYTAKVQAASEDDDYAFKGWYTDKDLKNKFTDKTVLSVDTTLYGRWDKSGEKEDPTKTVTSDTGKDDAAVKVGDKITYTIAYKNHKPAPATVVITDKLDSGVKFDSSTEGGTHSGEAAGGTVTWTIDNVVAGATGSVTVTVEVLKSAESTVDNTASVKIGHDPTVNTNTAENPVNIDVKYEWVSTDNPTDVTKPDGDTIDKNSKYTAKSQKASSNDDYVFVGWYTDEELKSKFVDETVLNEDTTLYGKWAKSSEKQDPTKVVTSDTGKNDAAVKIGDKITYTIEYYNHKPAPAKVIITDTLDSGVKYDGSTGGGTHSGEAAGGTVTWTIDNVAAYTKGSVTVTVEVLKTAESTVENIASVKIGNDADVNTDPVINPVQVSVSYQWVGEIIPKDVTPPLNGGSDVMEKGKAYDAREQEPTNERIGKNAINFEGWYTDRELTQKFENGTAVNEDMILYGVWEEGEERDDPIKEGYPIYIDYVWVSTDNPTDVTPPKQVQSESGKAYDAEIQDMTGDTKYVWVFEGWYADRECTTSYVNATVLDRDTTLYGKWIKEEIETEPSDPREDPKNDPTNEPTDQDKKNDGKGAQTGDDSNMGILVALAALAALSILAVSWPSVRRRLRSK